MEAVVAVPGAASKPGAPAAAAGGAAGKEEGSMFSAMVLKQFEMRHNFCAEMRRVTAG